MFHFIETIRIENGMPQNFERHCERMNRTRREVLGIAGTLSPELPWSLTVHDELLKWRIIYAAKVMQSEILSYQQKSITRIKKVYDDEIGYAYKYLNRSTFENHLRNNPGFDEVLIIKNRRITDTSYSNICLFDGKIWVTPKYPLLQGVRRSVLLDSGIVREADILEADLPSFSKIALVNAMLDLGDLVLTTDKFF